MSDTAIVSLVHLDTYSPKAVDAALVRLLAPLGGIEAFVKSGDDVVLKPNFLRAAVPEKALTTHPEIIRGVARLVQRHEVSRIRVTDSCAVGTATRVARRLGLITDDTSFAVVDADEGTQTEAPGNRFHRLTLSSEILNAGVLINLPKVKTHGQMVLTGAVKNMFGAVVGLEKMQWHFRIGKDTEAFARLLVDISERVSASLSIIDGVYGMEGNGPGSGDPRPLGLLMAAANPHAADAVLCRILRIPENQVLTLKVAAEMGLLPSKENISIVGDAVESFQLDRPWKSARPLTLNFVQSQRLAPLLNRIVSVRPHIDRRRCTVCGQCIRSCAAKAMRLQPSVPPMGAIAIDSSRCISCFCCQEICPTGAITIKTGFLARLLGL